MDEISVKYLLTYFVTIIREPRVLTSLSLLGILLVRQTLLRSGVEFPT